MIMLHFVVVTFNHIHVNKAQHIIIALIHSFFCQIHNIMIAMLLRTLLFTCLMLIVFIHIHINTVQERQIH